MGGGLEFSWFGAQSSRRFGARKLNLVRVAPAASAAVSLQKQDVSLRFASAEGVVVIGTTNRPDILDKAMTVRLCLQSLSLNAPDVTKGGSYWQVFAFMGSAWRPGIGCFLILVLALADEVLVARARSKSREIHDAELGDVSWGHN